MHRIFGGLAAWAIVVPVALGADAIPAKKVDGALQWVYGYAEGKKVGKQTGKPLFVVFRCER